MPTRTLETDYLVVGAGAAGMAFVDALVTDSDADVVVVDRRHAPGGHWNDAYPFVRLHQPSAYYGVNSLPLGTDAIDRHGANQGFYERAGAAEICAYYDRVMRERLLASGRVRYFPMSEYVPQHRIVSRISDVEYDVRVKKRLVDARYLEPSVPATTRAPFEVASDARAVPVNALTDLSERADGYTIIGAGKTAADACLWLLEAGVPPETIRWVKPREAWYTNRTFAQGGELVATLFEGISLQVEAAAEARSLDDLFARLRASAQLLSVDASIVPTMYKAATMSTQEIESLARITAVVRLGRVRRIERDSMVLDEGSVPTSPRHLHVHCAARGLNPAPVQPLFSADKITLQPIRSGLIPFNAALAGFVEATYDDVAHKNRLCPPNRLPDVPLDWAKGLLVSMNADHAWSKDVAVSSWLERSRLNPSRGLKAKGHEPLVQAASKRFGANVRRALEQLRRLAGETVA
jgi:hypothetical protein